MEANRDQACRFSEEPTVGVTVGAELARYGFPDGHAFGPDRMDAFWNTARTQNLPDHVKVLSPTLCERRDLELFHTPEHIDRVIALSKSGSGLFDHGDTPAFPKCYEAASFVVGSVLDAVERIMTGTLRRMFVPIAGLHHARRNAADGFCIFNDCAIAIEALRTRHNVRRIAYVDIDAHHGDGVYFSFDSDPDLIFVDIHQDGIYPGTGNASAKGRGPGKGKKLNLTLHKGDNDDAFSASWTIAERFLLEQQPEFIIFQCGADSIAGDPIASLGLSEKSYAMATRSLIAIADRYARGRLLVTGGGGYNRQNIADGWCAVLSALLGDV